MPNPNLRPFPGDADNFSAKHANEKIASRDPGTASAAAVVTVRVRDVLPALVEAIKQRKTWVEDFQDDPIAITRDLYEVLLAADRYKRSAA
jgi:hypothetical protein